MPDQSTDSQAQPDEAKEESKPSRRTAINVLLGGSFCVWMGSVAYPIVRYLIPPAEGQTAEQSVKVGTVDQFAKNTGTIFRIGNKPGLLIRTEDGEFRAFIAICTHLDCTVQFKRDESIIWCACHNGRYNLKGLNISGPPPRPLDTLDVSFKGDEVYVSHPS